MSSCWTTVYTSAQCSAPSQHTQTVPARVPYVIPHGALTGFPAGARQFFVRGMQTGPRRDNPYAGPTVPVRVPANISRLSERHIAPVWVPCGSRLIILSARRTVPGRTAGPHGNPPKFRIRTPHGTRGGPLRVPGNFCIRSAYGSRMGPSYNFCIRTSHGIPLRVPANFNSCLNRLSTIPVLMYSL